ncbi:ROK family protein [Neotabrizicola shimadae]|uniref:ROK family protein n=1 Tax=Neotabrizicola shimadae TaxID=2807096 RepID=A0A8G0ZYU3_9RHOB|nr:ROK family protein [Neotabrizicola shimadae]QYZ70734.1 ROK family protein [Neotabrizicola shimadae]
MIAAGIDLGGTKIEAQLFDADWALVDRRRIATPGDYPALVAAMADQIAWIETHGPRLPVGISAAGLVNPATGLALTANLAATGKPFPADIAKAARRPVTYINDCRALTLSEAVFGAAKGQSPAVGLILGTGIGGGVAIDGRLVPGPSGTGGEFGHFALPAGPIAVHGLPVPACGCGRVGCTETLIAGPGLTRIALHLTGQPLTPPEIAARRNEPAIARVFAVWVELLAELLKTITLVIDPACIVLGGGLSQIAGLIPALDAALNATQLPGFAIPRLALAQGGDASGARGAAYAALQES